MEKRRQEKILCRSTWSFARDTHRSVKEPVDKRGQNDLVKKCVKRKGTNRALCFFFLQSDSSFGDPPAGLRTLWIDFLLSATQGRPEAIHGDHKVFAFGRYTSRDLKTEQWGRLDEKGRVDFGIRGPVIQVSLLKTMLRSLEVISLCLFKGFDRSFFLLKSNAILADDSDRKPNLWLLSFTFLHGQANVGRLENNLS